MDIGKPIRIIEAPAPVKKPVETPAPEKVPVER